MNTQSEKRIRNSITIITIALLLGVVGYVAYAIATKNLQIPIFQIVLSSFLLIYFVLMSIVEPYLLKRFENITAEQKQAYLKFLGIDGLGIACLLFFVYTMGDISESGTDSNIGLYAALGYLVTSRFKYKFKNQFLGVKEETKESKEVKDEGNKEESEKLLEDTDKEEK